MKRARRAAVGARGSAWVGGRPPTSATNSSSAFTPSRTSKVSASRHCIRAPASKRSPPAREFTQVRLSDGVAGWVKSGLPDRRASRRRAGQAARRGTRPQPGDDARPWPRRRREARWNDCSANSRQRSRNLTLRSARQAESGGRQRRRATRRLHHRGLAVSAALIAALCGFWLGYATLARRVRRKFGGIKVY